MAERLTDDDIGDMLRTATHDERLALLELRERRAADLSSEDLKRLGYARTMLREALCGCTQHPDYVNACTDIDKLLAKAGLR